MCTAWRLMLESCACDDEIVVKSLEINKLRSVDQISKVFHAVYGILCYKICYLNKFIWSGGKLPQEWDVSTGFVGIKVCTQSVLMRLSDQGVKNSIQEENYQKCVQFL